MFSKALTTGVHEENKENTELSIPHEERMEGGTVTRGCCAEQTPCG